MTERFFIQETKRANCCVYLRQHSTSTLRPRSATESETKHDKRSGPFTTNPPFQYHDPPAPRARPRIGEAAVTFAQPPAGHKPKRSIIRLGQSRVSSKSRCIHSRATEQQFKLARRSVSTNWRTAKIENAAVRHGQEQRIPLRPKRESSQRHVKVDQAVGSHYYELCLSSLGSQTPHVAVDECTGRTKRRDPDATTVQRARYIHAGYHTSDAVTMRSGHLFNHRRRRAPGSGGQSLTSVQRLRPKERASPCSLPSQPRRAENSVPNTG